MEGRGSFWGNSKIVLEENFEGFWRVNMNSSRVYLSFAIILHRLRQLKMVSFY